MPLEDVMPLLLLSINVLTKEMILFFGGIEPS
jgi:hypothetical protein